MNELDLISQKLEGDLKVLAKKLIELDLYRPDFNEETHPEIFIPLMPRKFIKVPHNFRFRYKKAYGQIDVYKGCKWEANSFIEYPLVDKIELNRRKSSLKFDILFEPHSFKNELKLFPLIPEEWLFIIWMNISRTFRDGNSFVRYIPNTEVELHFKTPRQVMNALAYHISTNYYLKYEYAQMLAPGLMQFLCLDPEKWSIYDELIPYLNKYHMATIFKRLRKFLSKKREPI